MSVSAVVPAEAKRHYFWTTTEVSALQRLCESGTDWSDLAKALPGRSEVAVYQKAVELGFTRPWTKSQRPDYSHIDHALQDRLTGNPGSGAIKQIAEDLKVPAWLVSRRAGQLGLSKGRLKEPNWTSAEIEIVDRYGEEGVALVMRHLRASGFQRSVGSISSMLRRRQVEQLGHMGLSARAVAEMMGVDGKTVVRWIEVLGLPAKSHEGIWQISRKSLRKWLLDNPASFSLEKVRQDWFMGLMRGD